MNYSIERDRIWVLSFAKNISKHLSNKYGQKLLSSAKKPTADATKTVSKRAIQKTAKATRDLIGNKIADKITNVSKKSTELQNNETEAPKKKIYIYIYIYIQKKDKTLLMN